MALAGCQDGYTPPPRDFNELIPRIMGIVNRTTPEEAAAKLFDVTSPDERRDAIAYLQTKPYGHEPPYMKAYEILATDPHAMVRGQALLALGTSHQADAVPYLVKGLNDREADVRQDAAVSLTKTYTDDAIAPLIRDLKGDTDAAVRLNCARALKSAPTRDSMQAMEAIMPVSDDDAAVVLRRGRLPAGDHSPKFWRRSSGRGFDLVSKDGICQPTRQRRSLLTGSGKTTIN